MARKKKKKRVQVTVRRNLTLIEIRGFKPERNSIDFDQLLWGPLPQMPNDGGLVRELQEWMHQEGLHSVHTPRIGGGGMVAYFTAEDGERVLKWLKKHNS